jgi:hypothetical protein
MRADRRRPLAGDAPFLDQRDEVREDRAAGGTAQSRIEA